MLAWNAVILLVKVGAKVSITVEFSISPFNWVSFYFSYFVSLLWGACSFINVTFPCKVIILLLPYVPPPLVQPLKLCYSCCLMVYLVHLFTFNPFESFNLKCISYVPPGIANQISHPQTRPASGSESQDHAHCITESVWSVLPSFWSLYLSHYSSLNSLHA